VRLASASATNQVMDTDLSQVFEAYPRVRLSQSDHVRLFVRFPWVTSSALYPRLRVQGLELCQTRYSAEREVG
jgi:hypothetical protein